SLDITIIIAYFALVLLIGIWVGRKAKTGDDLFLGGRSLTWGFIGLSLFASNISSTTLVGLAGAAYTTGIVQSVYEWGSAVPFAILALIFVPLYIKSKITTIPEFLELRFDRRARMFFSSLTVVASIMIDTAGSLYAGALVIQIFFPQIELWQTCYALALFTGIYTSIGGLKAVVYTDAIQAVILIFGASALTYLLFEQLDFSWSKVVDSAPEGHFSVVKPLDDEGLPWPGLLLGVPMLGFWYMATNQYITQRVLGAKDIQHARWGVMLAGLLKFLPLFIMVLPGAMAISLFPSIENSDMVFPTMVIETLPIGLIGLVLAGLISAIMSSISSTLNSASTLVVVDFIKPNNPGMSEKQIVRATRISTLAFMVIAALWAPQIINFGGLWTYLQQMYSIFVPPVIVLFGVGILYKRGNGDGAFWTLIIGALIGVLFFVLGIYELWPIHYTINIGIVVGLCTIVFIVISRMTPAPDYEKIKPYLYRKSLINESNENLPWYKDYRYHVVVLMVLFVLSYV
ncbi:MAG: sodium:solute symporter, partial [Bacteroidota bacterium]